MTELEKVQQELEYTQNQSSHRDSPLIQQLEDDCTRLRQEIEQWKTWGIVEIAVRNPNVAEYCKHWEDRAGKAEAQNTRLKAPVSRHNEADGILQRFFITGGRQYRYTKQDGADLEELLNEWIASRAAIKEGQ